MKAKTFTSVLFFAVFLLNIQILNAQINIQPGPDITPENMVEYLVGPGVDYDNVVFQGADVSRGIFNNGNTTNIGLESGIFLTSGGGYIIPGPNNSGSAGTNNGMPGHPLLESLTTASTYNAAVLEFDFVPLNDTVKCNFVFGSEEYNEWVGSSFNDVFGFFITGPKPDSGYYYNKNIALVPGTNTAITINNVNAIANSIFYIDNTNGLTIQYDGFTTVITLWALVIPYETYHFTIGVADAGDGIYDSGVLIEGTSFKSLGPPEFQSFGFLAENNPQLTLDIVGELIGNEVFIDVPEGTDISGLIASFEVRGVEVFVNDSLQESGVSSNDFTLPVNYHLEGYANQDWIINVDNLTHVRESVFPDVRIGPSPARGEISIQNASGINVRIFDLNGSTLLESASGVHSNKVILRNLPRGMYFIELEEDGLKEVRKMVCY